jgi:CheY-like chemotaxis protein
MTSATSLPRVLCIDDEERVLQGLALTLREDYDVRTASSGSQGLQALKQMGGAAVVISDMRMPQMDGATFLHHVMHSYPDATRMLLTGDPGRDSAIAAVNRAQVFRFLAKPCPPEELKAAVEAGVLQHHLVSSERRILRETLVGCIQTLVDVLAIVNPVAFGRASRIKRLAMDFAASLGRKEFWQLEAAAMLSQLGHLSLPSDLLEKLYYGESLTSEERLIASGAPDVARRLLANVPRLEPVVEILAALDCTDVALQQLGEGPVGVGARILALVTDYHDLILQGETTASALKRLRGRRARYGAQLLDQFGAYLAPGRRAAVGGSQRIALRSVEPGMVILQEVRTSMGTLLVPSGFEVTAVFLERLRHFGPDIVNEIVAVTLADTSGNPEPDCAAEPF